jgi:hypothetical protein
MVTVSRVRRVGGRGRGGKSPLAGKGVCAATVSGLGEREGRWELKELAAGGSVSSCCLLVQYLIQSCARGGRRIVEDMCYKIRVQCL